MFAPKLINGDLVIEDGELLMVEGAAEIAQCCEIIIGTNKGEWFLNPGLGIEFSKLHGKNVTEEAVREQIRAGLRQEPRIDTVESIAVVLDNRTRESKVTFVATSTNGEVVEGGTG